MKKQNVSQLSYLCARLDLLSSETFSLLIFFLLRFSSLALPISAFHLSILSKVWLLTSFGYLRLNASLILPNKSPYLWFWWVWGSFWGNVTQCHEPTLDPFLGYELYMFERSLKSKLGLWHWFLSHYSSICVGESWENTLTGFTAHFLSTHNCMVGMYFCSRKTKKTSE